MGLHTPPVFMITGIKIAHGAVSVNVELNSYEAGEMQESGKPRAETKVPEDVWQDIASKVGDNPATLYLEHEAPFVMAIEARRIQVRKADFEDMVFDEYASIPNDHGSNTSHTDCE